MKIRQHLQTASRALGIAILVGLCLPNAYPNAPRALHFPEDHILGSVYSRIPPPEDSHYLSTAWDYIGLARESVDIPAGHEAQLEISRAGLRHLGELRALGANDLQCLILRDLNATDCVLTNVLHLSGLRANRLSGNPITDHGVRLLTNSPVLIDLNLSDTPVTDRGIADVARIESLRNLGLASHLSRKCGKIVRIHQFHPFRQTRL